MSSGASVVVSADAVGTRICGRATHSHLARLAPFVLRESINLVVRGVNQACSSLALQQLFAYVLQVGNLLNFGTESAPAAKVAGFALSSLEKVAQTKAFVGGVTLLQFVVQAVNVRRSPLPLPSQALT